MTPLPPSPVTMSSSTSHSVLVAGRQLWGRSAVHTVVGGDPAPGNMP